MLKLLRPLAALHSLQTAYTDARGVRRVASEAALRAVLAARGVETGSERAVRDATRRRAREIQSRPLEPVYVAWGGRCRIDLGPGVPAHAVHLDIEDGSRYEVVPSQISRGRLELRALPFGYHTLRLRAKGREISTRIFSAPLRAWSPPGEPQRRWGIFAPLYAVHSQRGWGIGDFRDAEALLEWSENLGSSVFATLPLLANFLRDAGAGTAPFDPSPYAPVSRLFWNEIYLDVDALPELDRTHEARRLIESEELRRELQTLRAGTTDPAYPPFARRPLLDYRRIMTLKRRVLELLASRFWEGDPGEDFRRFIAINPDVDDYASFRAAVEKGGSWRSWPARARGGHLAPTDFDEKGRRYHLYVQFATHRQLTRLAEKAGQSGGLYLDFPLGTHSDGYDVWRHQSSFATEARVGAPPDISYASGQNWGFAPLDPDRSRESGHRLFIAAVSNHLRYAKMLRVDHVMGLHRMWWIAPGSSPADGVYVRYPAGELYAIFNIESHRSRAEIVGEDLGTVPRYVRSSMSRRRLRRLFVLQRQFTHLQTPPPGEVLPTMLASINNHDLFPFAGFWRGDDLTEKNRIGIIRDDMLPGELEKRARVRQELTRFLQNGGWLETKSSQTKEHYAAASDFLAASVAGTVLVTLEDLWLETDAQNIPTTTTERPNWRLRFRYDLDSLFANRAIEAALRRMDHVRRARGEHGSEN